ncbi:hypothetical protein QEN19_001914 [Hanseniaspora menglaensis]
MAKFKRRNDYKRLQELYKNPLPIEFIDEFKPTLEIAASITKAINIPIFKFLSSYFKQLKNRVFYEIKAYFCKQNKEEKIIDLKFEKVYDHEYLILVKGDSVQRDYLWFNGFFGKGTLSRSQPTWLQRQLEKLKLPINRVSTTLEDMTRFRRQQREIFKQKREEYELKVEKLKQKNVLNPYEKLIKEYLELKELKDQIANQQAPNMVKSNSQVSKKKKLELKVDDDILNDNIVDLEDFILTIDEYLYLKLVVSKSTKNLWNSRYNLILQPEIKLNALIDSHQLKDAVFKFAVYFCLRNKSYIVKDGLKFGVDFIVYDKKGPVFQHAEYGVLLRIKEGDVFVEQLRNEDILSRLRVLNTSMKKMILVDVASNFQSEEWEEVFVKWKKLDTFEECEKMFIDLIRQCNVNQMLVKRWSVDRNRE